MENLDPTSLTGIVIAAVVVVLTIWVRVVSVSLVPCVCAWGRHSGCRGGCRGWRRAAAPLPILLAGQFVFRARFGQVLKPRAPAKPKGVRVGSVSEFQHGKMREVAVGEGKVLLVRVRVAAGCLFAPAFVAGQAHAATSPRVVAAPASPSPFFAPFVR